MPLVVVNRNPKKLNDEQLKILVSSLPESVASILTCNDPGGHLRAEDIEVWVQDFGPYDVNIKDVEIIIWANLCPGRHATLNLRLNLLCNLISHVLPKEIKGFIWILLQPGSFGEF